MGLGRFGSLIGFALSFVSAGAIALAPEAKWIGWFVFAVGLVTLFGSLLYGMYAHRHRWKEKLEPSHLIWMGLILAVLGSCLALGGFAWQQYRSDASTNAAAQWQPSVASSQDSGLA